MVTMPNPFRRVRVFISSKCDDGQRYGFMRSRLADMLNESLVFSAYIWERDGASTAKVEDSYISELNDSDIAVVVIDNADGVTSGVQKEIDQIRKTGKRAFFYFVTELSDRTTPLQKSFEGPDGPRYCVVAKMSEVPEQVIGDLQRDVLKLYRNWCNRDVDHISLGRDAEEPQTISLIPRLRVKTFPKLRGLFGSLVFGHVDEPDESSELDDAVTEFARSLYIDFDADEFDESRLLKAANAWLPSSYSELIASRWKALRLVIAGRYQDAVDVLVPVLERARSLKAEPWFIDDLLIDLRNIQGRADGGWAGANRFQQMIDDAGRAIVYPQLDRALTNTFELIERDRIKEGTQLYTTVTFGDNALRFLDGVSEAFAIASIFGSVTHISRTLLNLRTVTYYLCQKYHGANLNASLLMLSIACGGQGEAERVTQAFNQMPFDTDAASAWHVFSFCSSYRCLGDNDVALFDSFGLTACYLSEADYAVASSAFVQRAKHLLTCQKGYPNKIKAVFNAISGVSDRLPCSWTLRYVIEVLCHSLWSWQEEALSFLAHHGRLLACADSALVNNILDALERLLEENDHSHSEALICDVLCNIAVNGNLDVQTKVRSLAPRLSERSKERLLATMNAGGGDEHLVTYVNNGIVRIEADNQTQGVGGAYSYGPRYHVSCADAIASMDNPSGEVTRELYSACLGTLSSETFNLDGKIDACHACCVLVSKFGIDHIGLKSETLDCLNSDILFHEDFSIGRDSKPLLAVWSSVLRLLIGERSFSRLIDDVLRSYQEDTYTQAQVGSALLQLVNHGNFGKTNGVLRGCVFGYSGFLIKSRHFQLNLRGIQLMTRFLSDEELGLPAAYALLNCYDGQSPRGKQLVIDSLPMLYERDRAIAEEIEGRASRDNNVRIVDYLKKAQKGFGRGLETAETMTS